MKNCELCKLPATTYCESDQASLCWDCDAKVHGANFLVARHLRCLLCQTCQSPTPWRASGARLGHTVSVCERCSRGEDAEGIEYDNDEDDDGEDDDTVEDFEEEGENQVVPWSALADASPAPPTASSSSISEESGGDRDVSGSVNLISRKRTLENASDGRPREITAETGDVSGDLKRRFRDRTIEDGGTGGGPRVGSVTESGEESNHAIDLNFPMVCWRPI